MCGIVGHIGSLNSLSIVLDGLESLEYRGYDSAGVSVIGNKGKIETYKKEGRLANLKSDLTNKKEIYLCGIGHTRWATHGEVNTQNSHPHNGEYFSVVHNGIIENSSELKEELLETGAKFLSETDSEVFVRLLEKNIEIENSFRDAVLKTFACIEGNNCLVILNETEKKIYAIKNNAPLAVGESVNKDNYFVSSDPYSLQKYVDTIYFPENFTLCELSLSGGLEFTDINLEKDLGFKVEKNNLTNNANDKGSFEHFMLKEIWEQPNLIEQFLLSYEEFNLSKFPLLRPNRILIVACGTAYYAGLFMKNILEQNCRIPVSVDMASEFRYSNPVMSENDLAIFISQSGETADTLAALELCKDNKVPTLGILNVPHSTIYRQSDSNLLIHAGPEIGVASTKAFSLQCLTGVWLSHILNQDKFDFKTFKNKSKLLSAKIQEILNRTQEIKTIAEEIHHLKGFFFTGRNKNYPIALEGALKLKEIAYVHAEGYASGELKHGPIAMIDEGIVNIAYIDKNLFEKTLSNVQEIRTRKGKILCIGETEHNEVKAISDFRFNLDISELGELSPIALNVVGQLLSYYVAKHKGTDIDKPRNLAKSVTVE